MQFLFVFNDAILPIFLIVALAFVYNRLFQPDLVQITNLTLTVFAPIFVFDALTKNAVQLEILLGPLLFMAILTAALMALGYITAKLLNADANEQVSLVLSVSMINIGNFGLPLIFFAYGPEAVSHSVVYFVVFSIPLSTVAIYISSNQKQIRAVFRDVARIPLFHAMIIAMIVSHFALPVPTVLKKSMGLLGQATIPLLIFILGLQLSRIRINIRHVRFIVSSAMIRLIVSPILAWYILEAVGIQGIEKNVALIQTSAPAALLPLMYAIRFDRSPDLLAAMIAFTTIAAGISLTVLIRLIA